MMSHRHELGNLNSVLKYCTATIPYPRPHFHVPLVTAAPRNLDQAFRMTQDLLNNNEYSLLEIVSRHKNPLPSTSNVLIYPRKYSVPAHLASEQYFKSF